MSTKSNVKIILVNIAFFIFGIFFVILVIINIKRSNTSSNNSTYNNIIYSLREVSKDLNNNIDVNNDNLINCIDAAVLFYKYFPEKDKVSIVVNYNTVTGFHHLFNYVYLDGVWREIEPQSNWKQYRSYWMKDIWGSKYKKSKNKDVTQDYLRYIK